MAKVCHTRFWVPEKIVLFGEPTGLDRVPGLRTVFTQNAATRECGTSSPGSRILVLIAMNVTIRYPRHTATEGVPSSHDCHGHNRTLSRLDREP